MAARSKPQNQFHFCPCLKHDLGSRILENGPFEKCPDPVVLQVCRESRDHTSKTCALMQHPNLATSAFYLNPHSDVLCLTAEILDDEDYRLVLQAHYARQLNKFKSALLESCDWALMSMGKTSPFDAFNSLRHIQVLLEYGQSALEDDEKADVEMADVDLMEDGPTDEDMPDGPRTPTPKQFHILNGSRPLGCQGHSEVTKVGC